MPAAALRRKVTKGRVVRAPEGFEVGQNVNLVAISPRTWIMTLNRSRRPSALPPRFPPLRNRRGTRQWPVSEASHTPWVDGRERRDRSNWIRRRPTLKQWPARRLSRRSAA